MCLSIILFSSCEKIRTFDLSHYLHTDATFHLVLTVECIWVFLEAVCSDKHHVWRCRDSEDDPLQF